MPFLRPLATGLKVMLMVQEVLTASSPSQLLLSEKSPLAVSLAMTRGAVPMLLSVIGWDGLEVATP